MSELQGMPITSLIFKLQDECESLETTARNAGKRLVQLEAENQRWLTWSDGRFPDDSPGDVIAADPDGTIILDDGITTWNPLRALEFLAREALAGDGE